ncbi:MAG: conjugated bile salt MFS transporter [Terrisporobacter sp.]|uniref:conjugated bile salt MFS transporter n=1 Tax=Terrisporobacter sp. TaxID=1965305 RepID=UPI002FC9F1E9
MKTNKRKGIQKGWMMLAVCMLIQAIPFCVAANIQPLFMGSVIEEHGFSLTGFSLIFSIGTIVSAIAAPIIGGLFAKVNLKIIYTVGAILTGGGFMAFSMCTELWQFYVVAALVNIGSAVISAIGVPLLINSWFDGNIRGKALGIAFAGGSIGNIFMQQLVMRSIVANGTSKSYFIFGTLALVVALVIALFLVKMPKNINEVVKGNNTSEEDINTEEIDISYTLKEAQSTKFFWMMGIGFLFVGLYVSAYSIQYATYFQNILKLEPSVIALTGSIFAMCSLAGNVIGGLLLDKLGVTKTLMLSAVAVLASGVFIMLAGNNTIFAHIFSAVKGLAVFVYMMAPAYMVGEYFGKKEYGGILGMLQLVFAIGFSTGSVLFGTLALALGYNTTWIIILGFVVCAFISLITASKGMTKLNEERRAKLDNKMAA